MPLRRSASFLAACVLALAPIAAGAQPTAPPVAGPISVSPVAPRGADRVAEQAPDFADAAALAAWLRTGAPGGPVVSAHRGGYGGPWPENAIETFVATNARLPRALLETDIRLTRDSVLVLLHDETLDRTTTATGRLDALTFASTRGIALRSDSGATTFGIPTLDSALAWSAGRAVYTLDPKPEVPPARIVGAIRAWRAEGRAVVITYSAAQYAGYLALAPDLVYSVNIPDGAALDAHLALAGARADRMLAFVGTRVPEAALVARLRTLGIPAMAGVFGAREARALGGDASVMADAYATGVGLVSTAAVDAAVAARAVLSGNARPARTGSQ